MPPISVMQPEFQLHVACRYVERHKIMCMVSATEHRALD